MSTQKRPDVFVLDTLANDLESVEDMLRMLNSDSDLGWKQEWGRLFTREEVIAALSRLVRDDLVRAHLDAGDGNLKELAPRALPAAGFADVYFGLTPRGRLVHGNWDPTVPSEGDGIT